MRPTVLIVEQSPDVAERLAEAFHQVGCRVVGFCFSGLAALRRVSSACPDIVAIDMDVPQLPGVHTASVLKQKYPQLSVLAVNRNESRRKLAVIARVDGHLPCPTRARPVDDLDAHIAAQLTSISRAA